MTQTSSPMRKNETKTNILSTAHSPSDAHGNYPSDAPLFLLIVPLSTYRIKDFLIGGRRQAFVLKTFLPQNYRPLSICQTNLAAQPMETSSARLSPVANHEKRPFQFGIGLFKNCITLRHERYATIYTVSCKAFPLPHLTAGIFPPCSVARFPRFCATSPPLPSG